MGEVLLRELAVQPALEGSDGDDDVVVEVIAPARLALGGGHADHRDGGAEQADFSANGIAFREEFLADGLADDRDRRAIHDFRVGEEASVGEFPVGDREVFRGGALDVGLPGFFAGDGLDIGVRHRGHRADAGDLFPDHFDVVRAEEWSGLRAPALAGSEGEEVAADLFDLGFHRLRGPAAEGDEGDHGGDADDHADHGEEGTGEVPADFAEGDDESVPEHVSGGAGCWRRRTRSVRRGPGRRVWRSVRLRLHGSP